MALYHVWTVSPTIFAAQNGNAQDGNAQDGNAQDGNAKE